ncbi:MAG: low temperature requirement protein A [Hamadaea sp.]|nr:low temperature requirement protein A [Hamadaea sp.]
MPRLRTGERGHRQATWFELFYDLAFVVIVGQISHIVVAHPSWSGVGQAALIFVPAWWAWVGEVFYTTRFDADNDRAKRLLGTLQLVALTLMAASIARGGLADIRAIAGAYALIRTLQVIEIARAGHYIPPARPVTRHFVRGYGVGVGLWWVGTALPVAWGAWLWGIGLAIEVATYISGARFKRQFPPHVSHLPERYGLFTILVLGESFVGAVAGSATRLASWPAVALVTLAVAGTAALWWIYFDRIDIEAVTALATPGTGSKRPFIVWLFAHMPIAFGLMLVGAGIDLLLHEQAGHARPVGGFIFLGGQVVYLVAEGVVCATAVGAGPPQLRLTRGVAARMVSAAALVVVAALGWVSGSVFVTMGLSAAVLWSLVVFDYVRGHRVGVVA